MKKLLVAAILFIVLVGAVLAAVPFVEKRAAAQIKSEMERDGKTTVGAVEVGLLERRVLLTDLRSRQFGEIAVGRWQASGLAWPLDELIKGRTPLSGVRVGDPLQADRVELTDVRAVGDQANWSVGSLVIEGFDLGRYDPPPFGSPDALIHLGARVSGALSMKRVEQKDTVYTDVKGDKVAIGTVSLAGVDKGIFGSIAAAGFEVTPGNGKVPFLQIADAKLTNLDLRRAFTTLGQVAWRSGMPIGRLDLDAMNVSGFGGAALTRYGISLGSVSSEVTREGPDVKRSSLRIAGFVLAPPLRGLETLQLRIALQAMGLKDLRLDLDCAGTEDRGKSEVSIDRCALTGAELGEIDLAARLVGADAAFWQAVDDGDTFALLRTKAGLSEAKLVVVDRGLVERSLRAVATTSGQPLAAVRASFAQEVRRFQPPGVLITEAMTKLLDTVARFIETGGTLTLEARPDTPIGIDRLDYFQRPGPDLVETLGLSATLSR
ncbi:MAG: hypothetical protein KIS73_05670 [Enhydrobacter sp.]|nr:hypothetical protein [Enhydrobacter sp.]